MKVRIAFLQLLPGGSLREQEEIGEKALRRAKELGADIALFPEMWSCGYDFPGDPKDAQALEQLAIGPADPFLGHFGALAEELSMAVCVTFLERFSPGPRNSLVLFDRFGRRVLSYAKVHTCDFGDERVLTHGDGFSCADLDTAAGKLRVGAMICYDREFPESARILMLQGAELILVPNACPMEINRLCQLRSRAFENMLAVSTCNYPAGKPDCNGHSTLFDGVAWLRDEEGVRDMCVLDAGEEPGIYTAELDLSMLRDYRESEVHGNAYRRPWMYTELVRDGKEKPFVREDFRP